MSNEEIIEFANAVFVGNSGNCQHIGLKLDKDFIYKRQNRNIMAESKQPRDSHGHFASKTSSSGKKTNKKKVSKKETAVNWHASYDKKVLELEERKHVIKQLEAQLEVVNDALSDLESQNALLREKVHTSRKRMEFFESKCSKFLETIELQNAHNSELRSQLEWFKRKLPLYKRIFYLFKLQDMHENLYYLRMKVLDAMSKWK